MKGDQTTLTPPSGEHKPKSNKAALDATKSFAFDKSYWSFDRNDPAFAGQESLFQDLGRPLLDNAFQGYNNCIFAYGQTGSGKSYSMMGFGPDSGVIPRICRDMFDRIDTLQADKNVTCAVEVSYLEIYNERVRDLLNPATKGNLKVREHPSTGPYVEDLAKLLVRSFPEIENLMDEGNKARTVAATNMNETSSRSHAVFTLSLTQKTHDPDTKMDMERNAKISLVDLAGSERANSTGATGARLKEGAEINRSLSTLGRVIAALADLSMGKKKNASMVPYRDSVLTWLLKDSLGGNSMTAMIAAISPADINFEETLSTLRYADSAKRIKNHAVVNEDANARMVRELKAELAQLRSKLSSGNVAVGSNGVASEYPPDTPLDKQMVTFVQPDGTSKQVSKAEIAEQLSQSEKLYTDLNQTWEQKLQKTEEIHKEREAALEELGISIEKGFVGLSTPKKMPHLVNLSDDPLLAECLVYNLKPGNTTVGNDELATTAEIRLKGSKILQEHCVFENSDGVVTVIPNDNAAVMVNGTKIDSAKRLHSGYRVIFGDFHIFRFNHPQEARQEREEQGSMLKNFMNADDLDASPDSGGHFRSRSGVSKFDSDIDGDRTGADSPSPMSNEHDYDWSFARREAATALLGTDQKISSLSDEELDLLFDDLQRVRANRRGPREDDTDSMASFPVREKYISSSTMDNFSLDTALTTPSTPPMGETSDKSRSEGLGKEGEVADEGPIDPMAVHQTMQTMQKDHERKLEQQKAEYEQQLADLRPSTAKRQAGASLTSREKALARQALQKWRQRKYVQMASQLLQYASILKEAQILSQQMGKVVVFQFAIIDAGQTLGSSYDLVLTGAPDEEDEDLLACPKPCVGVRVADFKNNVLVLWSLAKLEKRLQKMRQMQQYLDRPEYSQHFRLVNPFQDSCMPQFSRVGEAEVSLAGVFESRVQDYVVDVISPFTFNVVAILKLSLEPSLAEAPAATMKFNVVLHDMAGFTEMEGTEVHAQISIPRISDEEGATTTQIIQDFNEGPIIFESLHGMSLPQSSSRNTNLRISLFANVTSMHLDKLNSWDEMRDTVPRQDSSSNGSRLPESAFLGEEKHDVFVRAGIHELSETGEYEPVEVITNNTLDTGAYQLHQGLQRRVVLELTHTCGSKLPWQSVTNLRVGRVRLLDSAGQVPELASQQPDISLKLVERPTMKDNADGTSNARLVGQWNSGDHASLLLDRNTADKYRVQISLLWSVTSPRLKEPLLFSMDVAIQIRPRTFIRAPSLLTHFWNQTHAAHSITGNFALTIKPNPIESAMDLWRMDTQYEFVKGEESLNGWMPRGVSLIRDYVQLRRQQFRAIDVEATKSVFGSEGLAIDNKAVSENVISTDKQKKLLEKYVQAWRHNPADPSTKILNNTNTEPPRDGAPPTKAEMPVRDTTLSATITFQAKNPSLLKAGYLLAPDPSQTRWIRRYVELRRPFLHVHSVPDGDELNAINLTNSRVDHQPHIAQLLQRSQTSKLNVFAIYARENTFLFATRSEREKIEWVLRLDESYLDSGSRTPLDSD